MKTDCSQKQLLNRIDQVSFAVNDMTLYLDTHPCDEKALTYCHELVQERKKLLKEYAEAYGPLIIDITDHLTVENGTVYFTAAPENPSGNGWNSHSHGKRKERADNLCGIMKKGFNIRSISHNPMPKLHSIS